MSRELQLKRGNNANLAALSLLAGEPVFVLDTGKLYVGNGTDKVLINPDAVSSGTADKLTTARKISLSGDVTGFVNFDGSSDVTINTTVGPIAITDISTVATEADMLALTAQKGDVCVRSDLPATFILKGTDPTVLTNWVELLFPTGAVSSVNGKTGAVVLTAADLSLDNVTNESKATMFTDSALTGAPTAPTAASSDNSSAIATTAFVKSQGYLTPNDSMDFGTF